MTLRTRLIFSIGIGILIGAGLAAAFPVGAFWVGWLSGALLSGIAVFSLISAWRWGGGGRALAWMVALAFLLRLILGAAISAGLPVLGYPEKEQKAGYLFYDAYKRDTDAWEIVRTHRPLLLAFGGNLTNDQYGGLMTFSALMYLVLSPDAHRAYLILILGAFVFALGVPFFYQGVRGQWGPKAALLAGWFLVLYPDGILFGASQMREPFLIGLSCIAFWVVACWPEISRRTAVLTLAATLALIGLLSTRIVLPVAGLLAGWFFLDYLYERVPARWKPAVWGVFGLIGIAALVGMGEWLFSSGKWDMLIASRYSGFSLKAIQAIGEAFSPVFYTAYGLARPLLPAAIGATAMERTPWIWKAIDVFRSTGWYAMAPLLLYGAMVSFRAQKGRERRVLALFSLAVLAWLLVSSGRAGGDQWDNPRYRTIFLPWLAFLSAWGVRYAVEQRCHWLVRLVLVEAVFVALFLQWYLSRYWTWLGWRRWTFWTYPLVGLALSAVIVAGGYAWDRYRGRRRAV